MSDGPTAVTENFAVPFRAAVTAFGCTVITGFVVTVSLAVEDVVVPDPAATRIYTRCSFGALAAVIVIVAVLLVKLGFFHVFPPSEEYCHW